MAIPAVISAKPDKFNFGLYLGGNMNMHSPDFNSPVIYDSTGYFANVNESANFMGFNFGIIGNFAINEDIFISGRIGYHTLNGDFSTVFDFPSADMSGTQDYEFDLSYLEISPMVQLYNIIPVDNLYLLGGIEIGVPMMKEYTLTQQRTGPPSFPQPDFPVEDTKTDDIPDAGVRLAIAIGAGYTFDLSENVFLSPEVSFRFPFTKVSANEDFDTWNVPQLRFGINLTFSIPDDDEVVEDTFVPELKAGIAEIKYRDINGTAKPVNKITVEEVQYQELFPLLPYVFFDKLSVEPTAQYQYKTGEAQAGIFTVETLEPNAIKINSKTLDVVGTRMQQNPNARISIVGTHDNNAEQGERKLSELRAKFAKDYIVENYDVDEDRITTVAGGVPEKASTGRVEDGIEENRRIEIKTTNSDIVQPIIIEKDRQRLAEPELVEFIPYITTNDSILNWTLEISQTGKSIRMFEGNKPVQRVQWNILPNELAASQIPVDYTFSVETASGLKAEDAGTIPVDYYSYSRKQVEERPDQIISKFSLVVFDFNSPEISDQDKSILEKNVVPAINANSKVQIYGYTDRIGNEDYNQKLALQRANNVKEFLSSKMSDVKFEVFGVGEEVEVYDNNSPVGRHLSRTVQIYVITPKK